MTIPRDNDGYSIQIVTDPVVVLASLLTSEAPNFAKYPLYSELIGGAVVNATRAIKHAGETFQEALVRRVIGTGAHPGKLGPQAGRWASTRQDPIAAHVDLAKRILADPDRYATEARGAIQWVDQKTQIYMNAKHPATNPTPEKLMARRYSQGSAWVGPIDGIDPFVLTLLGPTGVPLADAVEMLANGRERWNLPRL